MGSVREEQERVRNLLLDTVTLLCKNGLSFKKQLKVQGLLGITLDEDNVFIVHINEKVGEITVEHQKEDKKQNNVCTDNNAGSKDVRTHRHPSEKHRSRKRSSTSSPVFKGPPPKVKVKTEHFDEQFDDDLVLIDEDKSNIPKLTHIQGTHTGIQGTNFNNPNSMGDINEFGQFNPTLPNQYAGMPSAFVTGVVPNTTTAQPPDMSQTQGLSPDKYMSVCYSGYKQVSKRRAAQDGCEKKHMCDYPGCGLKYFNKRHMLRHQTVMHGRAKRGPFGRDAALSIYQMSNFSMNGAGDSSSHHLPKLDQAILDVTEGSLNSSDLSVSFAEQTSDSEPKNEMDDPDTVTLFVNEED